MMSVFAIKFSGLENLESTLLDKARLERVKTVVAKNGSRLQTQAQRNAPVGTPESTGIPGYVGGTLRRSIDLSIKDGGLTADVRATAHYAGYVELGTRFMAAQPYMKPAFNVVKKQFKSDLRRLMR